MHTCHTCRQNMRPMTSSSASAQMSLHCKCWIRSCICQPLLQCLMSVVELFWPIALDHNLNTNANKVSALLHNPCRHAVSRRNASPSPANSHSDRFSFKQTGGEGCLGWPQCRRIWADEVPRHRKKLRSSELRALSLVLRWRPAVLQQGCLSPRKTTHGGEVRATERGNSYSSPQVPTQHCGRN